MALLKDCLTLLCVAGLFMISWPSDARAESSEGRDVKILFELYSNTNTSRQELVRKVDATRKSFDNLASLTVLLADDAASIARAESPDMPEGLRRLINRGVEVIACERSLDANGIGPGEVDPMIGTVNSAADERRRREEAGWTIVGEGETYVSGFRED